MNNSILIISENEDSLNILQKQLVMLRFSDMPAICAMKDAKKNLSAKPTDIIILKESDYNKDFNIKFIQNIKINYPNSEIIILTSNIESNRAIEYYDAGAFDCIDINSNKSEMTIKILNCLKYINLQRKIQQNNLYFENVGLKNMKNECISIKYIKEIFNDLISDKKIQNGVFCIVTLEDQSKTKVALNRLAGIINKSIRQNDLLAESKEDSFYIIFENITLADTKNILIKIQDKMGDETKIKAGINKIGIQDFEELEKNTKDSLLAAIKNNEICSSIITNIEGEDNNWIADNIEKDKRFKLFDTAYNKKLKSFVEPTFYRYKKEFENKFKNSTITQYTNKAESAFCIKGENITSELILRHDGYTKIIAEITHSGLDSAENSKIELTLNKFTEKELIKLLKQLKLEFMKNK